MVAPNRMLPCCIAAAIVAALTITSSVSAQQANPAAPVVNTEVRGTRILDYLFGYLNMAGSGSDVFKPLTQRERTSRYGKSMINPLWYAKAAISAGQNQLLDTPEDGNREHRDTANATATLWASMQSAKR